MKLLDELVELANKANAAGQGTPEMVDFRVVANPDNILAIAEAFRTLEQRAEAAETKLAELGASVSVYQYESAIYNEENGDTDWYWDDCDKGFYDQYDRSRRRILFTRPAPAINLAELVPQPFDVFKQAGGVMVAVREGKTKNHLFGKGYNACIAYVINSIINSGELTRPDCESDEARLCEILRNIEEAK